MTTFDKTLRMGVAVLLLASGIATVALGQVSGVGSSFGGTGAGRSMVQIKGRVICARCSLDEVRQAQPNERQLYQLSHKHGQVVMKVTAVNDAAMFDALARPPRLWVRAADSLLQQLSAEENLFKEMEITGLLSNTRTLDMFSVTIG